MNTHATCLWCQEPIELTLTGWVHEDGQSYDETGHQAHPDRTKPPHTEGEGGPIRAPGHSSSGVGRKTAGLAFGPAIPPAADPPP